MKKGSRNIHVPKMLEYSQITPYVFIGTNMCCTRHFDEKLLACGIRADISLEEELLDSPQGVKFFLWLPTRNLTAPSKSQLLVGVNALQALVKQHVKCYVHCRNGHGRAPTLVAAYLIAQGMNLTRALNILKKKRPTIHLESAQLTALKRFEKNGHFLSRLP